MMIAKTDQLQNGDLGNSIIQYRYESMGPKN